MFIYTTYTPNKDTGKKPARNFRLPFSPVDLHMIPPSHPFKQCSNFYHHTLVLSVLELHLNAVNRYYFLSFFTVVPPPIFAEHFCFKSVLLCV